jgi:oxalate---CoA ligase
MAQGMIGMEQNVLTIPRLIERHARERPDLPALASERRVLTWRELAERTSGIAASLRDAGVTPSDRIAVLCTNPVTLDDAVTIFGVASACALAAIDAEMPLPWRRRLVERIAPAAIIAAPGTNPSGLPAPCWSIDGASTGSPRSGNHPLPRLPEPDDVFIVVTTSGTTAEPKLVPETHRMLLAAADIWSREVGLDGNDRLLVLSAVQFGMFGIIFVPILHGGMTILPERRQDDSPLRLYAAHQPTWTTGAPPRLAQLADLLHTAVPGPRTSFRIVLSAGAPTEPGIEDRIARGFRAPRVDLYSTSESISIAFNGRITTDLRIAGPDDAVVPPGEPGEVQTRGDLVFPGYIDAPDLDAAAFTADGWYRTGDLGRIGEDGRLVLLGRLSDLINRGGVKIAPQEVEAAILGHPGVAEAAAYPVPHPDLGQQVGLAIILAPGSKLTPRAARRWLIEHLPAAKVPRAIRFLDALPRTANGKVSRKELAEMVDADSLTDD